MKIKKLTPLLFGFISLSGCIESTALLGPAITIGNTGNIYQASLSYASNQIVYNTTGKTTISHVAAFLDTANEFEENLNLILKDSILDVKRDLGGILEKTQKKLVYKKKEKPEPILNSRLENFDFGLEDQFILF